MEIFDMVMLSMPGGWELILILVVVVLLFGGRKIPELMKGLGQGLKEFKDAKDGKNANSHKEEDTLSK